MKSNTNKIEIPASLFRKIQFQDGGQMEQKHEALTGQFIHSIPEAAEDTANAEIEDEEFVKTKGTVVKAKGETHEDGGIDVRLDEGDKVLSDHLKVGKDLAKQLSKDFDLKVNPTDTYAKALDKYLKKIGHTEKTEELKEYIGKLDEQKQKVKDESTLALNSEYLMNEINEETEELNELEPKKQGMFDFLFAAQESTKKVEEQTNNFQKGGMFSLMEKYNISPERVKQMFQDGGGVEKLPQNYIDAISIGKMAGQVPRYSDAEKKAIREYYNTVVKDKDTLKVLNDRIENNTLVYNPNLLKEIQENKDIPLQYQTETEKNLFGVQTDSRLKDYLYASDFQNKFGRPFGTSPNDEALIYDEVIKSLEGEGIKYHGSPTTNIGTKLFGDVNAGKPKIVKELEANKEYTLDATKYKTASPQEQESIARGLGVDKNILDKEALKISTGFINFKPKEPASVVLQSTTPTQEPAKEAPTATPQTEEERRRMGLLLMPERMFQNPSFLAPMKFSPTIYSGERVEISPEQQLMEINRQQQSTQEQLAQLPDAQRAATMSSMDSNFATAASKAVSDAARYNAQARERESYEQAQVKTRQSLADAQSAAQYQQLMGRELAAFEANLQNENNARFQDQFQKWMAINQYNRNNALNPDVTFTGSGYEVRNPNEYIQNMLNTKAVGKKGGRFNKKRFGY